MVLYARAGQKTKWKLRVLQENKKNTHTDSVTLGTMANGCARDTPMFLTHKSCYEKDNPICCLWEDIAEIWSWGQLLQIALQIKASKLYSERVFIIFIVREGQEYIAE